MFTGSSGAAHVPKEVQVAGRVVRMKQAGQRRWHSIPLTDAEALATHPEVILEASITSTAQVSQLPLSPPTHLKHACSTDLALGRCICMACCELFYIAGSVRHIVEALAHGSLVAASIRSYVPASQLAVLHKREA